jgi:gamma-glutamyltranspeptidase/glutathione hydrolase
MSNINPDPFTTRPEIEGTFGVVTSTHWIATAVGMATLEKGGNAFDAGVATAFALQVVEPHLNGPGGDAPIIVHDVRRGRTEVICGQGPAPQGATIAHYRSEGLEMVPGTGLLAACVPGTFESWMLLLRDYGTLRLRDVLEPAIAYARDGYPLVERASATIATVEQLFRKHWTTSAAVYLPDNEVPKPGTLFTNRTLSETYARILKEAESAGSDRLAQIERARKAWSHGFVAEAIDEFCRTQAVMDVSGSPHLGVLRADDMARWQPTVEAPLTYDYGCYTVCKAGVWSQGPVMLQQLALLKGFELDGLDPTGPEFIHLQVECAKLAYADREKFYGDPNFTEIPIATLLSDAYNDKRRKLISEKASLDFVPGSVEGFGAVVKLRRQEGHREAVGAMGAGEPTVGRFGEVRGDTVHFDIIDQAGNMVSATPSGGWLQSSPVIPKLGFCLGSRAQMFWLEENHPAALAPGKRPRTTLSPTMALRDGEPYLSWGSPGGDQQDQWITQFFLRHVHAKMNLQESIDAPAWHSEHFPISFWPRAAGHGRQSEEPRPYRGDRPGLVGRPPHRRLESRASPPRRRQSPRHAGLCGRTIEHDPEKWEPVLRKDHA